MARMDTAAKKMSTFSPKGVISKKEGFVMIKSHSMNTYRKAAIDETIARLIGENLGEGKKLRKGFILIINFDVVL
jgi:hypothetical protein